MAISPDPAHVKESIEERRECLKQHKGKRIVVEGRLQKYGSYHDYTLYRRVPSVCVQDIDLIEEGPGDKETRWPLLSYCWVGYSRTIEEAGAEPGDVVRFTALVYQYEQRDQFDHNKKVICYSLKDPIGVEVVRRLHGDFGDAFEKPRGAFPPSHVITRENGVPKPPPTLRGGLHGHGHDPVKVLREIAVSPPPPPPPPPPAPIPVPVPLPSPVQEPEPKPAPDKSAKMLMAKMLDLVEEYGIARVKKAVKAAESMGEE